MATKVVIQEGVVLFFAFGTEYGVRLKLHAESRPKTVPLLIIYGYLDLK